MNFRVKTVALLATAFFAQSAMADDGLYLLGGIMAGDIEAKNTATTTKVPAQLVMFGAGKSLSDTVDVEGRVFMTAGKASKHSITPKCNMKCLPAYCLQLNPS